MTYSLVRFRGHDEVVRLNDLDHETCMGIVKLVWGVVPQTLEDEESGTFVGQEWKLHIGGPDWVIVARTA